MVNTWASLNLLHALLVWTVHHYFTCCILHTWPESLLWRIDVLKYAVVCILCILQTGVLTVQINNWDWTWFYGFSMALLNLLYSMLMGPRSILLRTPMYILLTENITDWIGESFIITSLYLKLNMYLTKCVCFEIQPFYLRWNVLITKTINSMKCWLYTTFRNGVRAKMYYADVM